jgi:hypothetical protein
MQARRRRFPRRCHRTNGRFFKATHTVQRRGVDRSKNSTCTIWRASADFMPGEPFQYGCLVTCFARTRGQISPLKGNNHPMLASALDQVFSNERALLL